MPGDVWRDQLDAFVVPAGACGGPGAMALMGSRTLVVAVEENSCALDVTAAALQAQGVVVVRSYMEAIGLLAAHKAGVNPSCLTDQIASIREFELSTGTASTSAVEAAESTAAGESVRRM